MFAELDNKRYAPGYLEKPLIKNYRDLTMRGPAETADVCKYVRVESNGRGSFDSRIRVFAYSLLFVHRVPCTHN